MAFTCLTDLVLFLFLTDLVLFLFPYLTDLVSMKALYEVKTPSKPNLAKCLKYGALVFFLLVDIICLKILRKECCINMASHIGQCCAMLDKFDFDRTCWMVLDDVE